MEITKEQFKIACRGKAKKYLLTPKGNVKTTAINAYEWAKKSELSFSELGDIAQSKLNKLNLANNNNSQVVFWKAILTLSFIPEYQDELKEFEVETERDLRTLESIKINAGIKN